MWMSASSSRASSWLCTDSVFERFFEASRLRFRPIIMTSATTVLAMVPMAIGLGSGEQLQRPLAITIIGGLTLTTLVTLFFTPIMYEMAHRIPRFGEPMKHEPETDSESAT